MSDRRFVGEYGAPNPYYDPDKCSLKLVATLDDGDLSYEFSTLILVKDDFSGAYYAAYDAGCSCPSPFENVKGLGDMTLISNERDMENFIRAANGGWKPSEVIDFMRKVREHLPS